MNSLTVAVFAVVLAVASAGVIGVPLAKSTVLQGPSTSTHVVGPDGSQIIANAPGGVINTVESVAAPVAYAAAPVAYAAPAHYAAAPLAYAAPAHYAAPIAYGAGPIAYGAGPLLASPLTAAGYPVLAAGSGIEGQYIHDFTEKLYDDGSYKGEIY